MKNITCTILIIILFTTCKKDINHNNIESYEKIVIYSESFDNDPNWKLLPDDEVYRPDSNCVKVEGGQLKLLFDQPLNNCGCAWVGVEYNNEKVYDSLLNKIGVKLTLKEGYFQYLCRAFDSINGSGSIISTSTFNLRFNSIDIRLPQSLTRFHRDSIIDFNTKDKLIGKEFEMIHDNGKEKFLIDGVEQPLEKVWLNWQNKWNNPLTIKFNLGHQPELSPRLDKLFIDEIEIYTWKGELK